MSPSRRPRAPLQRFLVYGAIGWGTEVLFLMAQDAYHGRPPKPRPVERLVMFPFYGLALPLFEPLHDAMRDRLPAPVRASVYSVAMISAEYTTGRIFRAAPVEMPWDYSHNRFNVQGLVRLDYLPLWGALGLLAERLHDTLTGRPRRPGKVSYSCFHW